MMSGAGTGDDLDHGQYEVRSILQYETVYGEDFVSPGGKPFADELISSLALAPGARVLDAGCGLGGSAFVMAGKYGLNVDAMDLSANMLSLARGKLERNGLSPLVRLVKGDCLELTESNVYDAIYSRDVFLHISDKSGLLKVLFNSLQPGGVLLFTDYCCGQKPWKPEFERYVDQRSYTLHTVDEYADLVRSAGFKDIQVEDVSDRFADFLRQDIERISQMDADNATELKESWQGKLERTLSGDHRWGMIRVRKPAAISS